MKKQTGRNFAYRAAARMLLFTGSPASPAEAGGLFYFGIFVLIIGLVSIIYPYFFGMSVLAERSEFRRQLFT